MSDRVKQLIRSAILDLNAYHVPPSAGMIKLDAMENPYCLPPEWIQRWLAALAEASLNRYPDAAADELCAALKKFLEIPENMALILGNGSDELIQLLCQAVIDAPFCAGRKPVVLAPEPGFVMYRMLAVACGLEYRGVPLRDDFALDLPAMLNAIQQHRPGLVFLAYPNNPTGNLFDRDAIEAIVRASPGLVIIDEAYHPFAESSFMDRLGEFDNLLVMRTVSKLGLAGIRLGVLAGPECWLRELNKLRLPYNINVLTQLTAKLACESPDIFREQARMIRAERQRLFEALAALPGIRPFPSRANFILFKTAAGQGDSVFLWLKQRNILIKNLSSAGGLLADCLRVTVGTSGENDVFLAAMRAASRTSTAPNAAD